MSRSEPRYPVFVVSKGRWHESRRLTVKALDRMDIRYRVIVEPAEAEAYGDAVGWDRLLVLPDEYKRVYEAMSDEPGPTGPGPARNFAWDTAVAEGAARHWVMDDNIGSFRRMNRNRHHVVLSGVALRIMEDFVDRYENVALAGPQYDFFVPSKYRFPPYVLNTRIYSCILIDSAIPYRWRGRYNEDTDLSLRVLKEGLCTVQFNAIVQEKKETQGLAGGNTDEFYSREGTRKKSEMIAALHPDVARVITKYGRPHHHVDYRRFRANQLRRRPGLAAAGVDEYGMRLVPRDALHGKDEP